MENSERQARPMILILVASLLVLFTVVAVIVIVAWVPFLPEAAAVNIDPAQIDGWMEYAYLHQSWHSLAALHGAPLPVSCAR